MQARLIPSVDACVAYSMGNCNFRPPTESTPLNRSPKNLTQVIMSATPTAVPHLVHIRPQGVSGRMGETV